MDNSTVSEQMMIKALLKIQAIVKEASSASAAGSLQRISDLAEVTLQNYRVTVSEPEDYKPTQIVFKR